MRLVSGDKINEPSVRSLNRSSDDDDEDDNEADDDVEVSCVFNFTVPDNLA